MHVMFQEMFQSPTSWLHSCHACKKSYKTYFIFHFFYFSIKRLAEREDRKSKQVKQSTDNKGGIGLKAELPDGYAECYPGLMEMNDAIDDSDDEADYSKMDLVSIYLIN